MMSYKFDYLSHALLQTEAIKCILCILPQRKMMSHYNIEFYHCNCNYVASHRRFYDNIKRLLSEFNVTRTCLVRKVANPGENLTRPPEHFFETIFCIETDIYVIFLSSLPQITRDIWSGMVIMESKSTVILGTITHFAKH